VPTYSAYRGHELCNHRPYVGRTLYPNSTGQAALAFLVDALF